MVKVIFRKSLRSETPNGLLKSQQMFAKVTSKSCELNLTTAALGGFVFVFIFCITE